MDVKEHLIKFTPAEADWISNNAGITTELRTYINIGCIVSLQALSGESLPVYEEAFRARDHRTGDSEQFLAEKEKYDALKKELAIAEDGTEKPIFEVTLNEAQKRELYEGIVRSHALLESLVLNAARQRIPIEQSFFDKLQSVAQKADAVAFEAETRIGSVATWRMVNAMKASLAAHLRLGEET